MRKLTITRALSELKMLKKRHSQVLSECNPIAVRHGNKLRKPYTSYKPEDFEKNIDPGMQSVEKLEDLIFEIKSKIDLSNSKTIVKIGTKEMTVQEAINFKGILDLKKTRLEVLKSKLSAARLEYDRAVEENKVRQDNMLMEAQKNNNGAKASDEDTKRVENTIEILYGIELLDHGLAEKIKTLETEIQDFETNVDFALSESNSITTIEISD